MALKIGEVITAKRKEKSWTQEQLANAVGVSVPAVSKWETGTTYPDITLLSPIARALHTTVDELLSYRNELTDAEASEYAKKATSVYESEGFDAGWRYCKNLLQEYPNSIPLKFYLGSLFQSFLLMKPGIQRREIQSLYRQAADLYEEVLSSGHPKFTFPTTVILIGFYTMLDELDRAEELLNGLPKLPVDADFLYPSIYALRGRHDEAIRLTQANIRRGLSRIGQELSVLCAYAGEREDMDTAHTLAKVHLEMTDLFGLKESLAYPDMIKVLIRQGKTRDALDRMEEYARGILELNYDYSGNPIFNRLAQEPKDPSYIKKALAQSVLRDEGYFPMKEEPRYLEVIDRLRGIVEAQTHTFDG